jgi:hypothetical protein
MGDMCEGSTVLRGTDENEESDYTVHCSISGHVASQCKPGMITIMLRRYFNA